MNLETAQLLWYGVFITCIFAYAALDGFDLGVGCLHLFTQSDTDRRIFMNAIGPVWDSNSLWVVITGGALLAGFPSAFAELLSALYIPMMLIIFCFTYRAVAIEFRSKIVSPKWRGFWDVVFSLASFGMAFGLGVVTANLIQGLPINEQGEFVKDLSALFSPYAVTLGCFATLLFMLHGSLYLTLKTTGALHERLKRWNMRLLVLFTIFWAFVNAVTPIYESHVMQFMHDKPTFYPIVFLGLVGIIALYKSLKKVRDGWAFLSSCLVILSLVLLYALGTYPNMVRSSINDAYSLTIYNSSSTLFTLQILLGMACLGVPLFLLYVAYAYRVFRGKVELDTMSY
ncbi:MAG: cytochrome d ubiquinol oxidase subunit II [Chlamydiales bacterium]|nr:cytochrome d ubiquinol oxidase subunit II [Chlamydiales bacterium]